jgi:hypothetical protein
LKHYPPSARSLSGDEQNRLFVKFLQMLTSNSK